MKSCLIVCRALDPDDKNVSARCDAFMSVTLRCGQALEAARFLGQPVIHVFRNWPSDCSLLEGCRPKADEPVLKITGTCLFGNLHLQAILSNGCIEKVQLIGAICEQILDHTLSAPELVGRQFNVVPGALIISDYALLTREANI